MKLSTGEIEAAHATNRRHPAPPRATRLTATTGVAYAAHAPPPRARSLSNLSHIVAASLHTSSLCTGSLRAGSLRTGCASPALARSKPARSALARSVGSFSWRLIQLAARSASGSLQLTRFVGSPR